MTNVLEVKGLSTYFYSKRGVVRAVDDVSFTIRRGEILGVVGESGCGKSVTSLSVMRLVAPPGRVVKGEVWLDGRDLLTLSDEEMRQIRGKQMAMIFQEPMLSMNPVLRVGDQIVEAIRVHDKVTPQAAEQRVLELMRQVGIPDPPRRYKQYPHQLSGGMQQRMMIAMALVNRPSLLIADEPVTALDVTIQAQILDLIKLLRDETGAAVLLITHDLGVVAETCDRVLVMYLGKVAEAAPVSTLFQAPQHPYTQGLFGSIPSIEKTVEWLDAIPGIVPSPVNLPSGCRFATRCPHVMPVCHEVEPPLYQTAADHRVACHLYAEKERA